MCLALGPLAGLLQLLPLHNLTNGKIKINIKTRPANTSQTNAIQPKTGNKRKYNSYHSKKSPTLQ